MTWTKPFIGPKAPWSTALLAIGLMTLFVLLGSQTAFGQTTYVQYGDFDDDGNGNLQWVGTVAPSVDLLDASTLNASFPKDPFGGSLYGVITKTESGAISSSPVRIPTTNSQTLRIMSGFNYDVSILGGVKFEDDTHAPGKGSNNTIIVDNGATVGNISNQTGSVYGGLAINNPASSNNEPSVTQNTVIIDGIIGQSVYGGATNFDTTTYTVDVTHNTVIINEYAQVNGTNDEAGKVVGGSIAYDNDPTATVNFVATKGSVDHNIVTMNGGEVRTIIGGMHELGDTGAIASANEVYIYGGSVTGDIIGGLIFNGVGTVDSNEVTLISGVIDGHVYGGLGDAASGISITGNIINFGIQDGENTGTVAVGNNLYGGFNKDTGGTKATGNTINFYSGRNTVDGTTSAAGNLVIKGGTNEFVGSVSTDESTDTVNFGKITITGGTNTFQGDIKADGAFSATRTIADWFDPLITLDAGNGASLNTTVIEASEFTLGGLLNYTDDTRTVNINTTSSDPAVITSTGMISFNTNYSTTFNFNKALNIDGIVDFRTAGNILMAQDDITVSGEMSFHAGNNIITSGGANGFTLTNGGLFDLANDIGTPAIYTATINAAKINFDSGSTVDIGFNDLYMGTSSTLKIGSLISLSSFDGIKANDNHGKITSAGTLTVEFTDTPMIDLETVPGVPDYWLGKTLINTNGGTISDADLINIGFYTVSGSTGNLVVGTEKLTHLSVMSNAFGSGFLTPNMRSGLSLMNRIANSGNNVALAQDLQDIISEISVYATQAQADVIMRQLIGESLVNVAAVAATTVLKSQGVVFNRLDRIREIELDTLTPPAAGTGVEPNRVWAGGFGVWTEADNRNHVYGYDYSGGGVALGYDRKVDAAPGLRVGVSMAYAAGEMRGKDSRTHVDTSTIGFGAYGSYLLPNNVFFDANVGYANTGNEYDIDLYPSGKKTGEFTIHSWQFGVRGGAVIQANNVQVIPSIGVRYLHYKQEGFRDTIRSNDWPSSVANHYARKTEDQWDIPLQVKVNGTFNTGPAIITPELRLGYTFAAKKPDYAMNVGFVGSDDTARIVGARAYGNSFQAGTGVKVNTGGPFDAFVNYDLDVTDGYRTHKASAGVGVEF